MTKITRVLSVIVAIIMSVTMLSAFSVSFAIDPQNAAEKAAADVNMFSNKPFVALKKSPGYGADVKAANIIFVDDDWAAAADNTYVYMQYTADDGAPLVYRAVKGENAFSTINDALTKKGRESVIIKVGAGTYGEAIPAVNINGVKFYGNYAGTCPNVPGADIYTMDLNPVRKPELESVITGKWQWTKDTYNITIDGFTVSGAGQFSVYNSSAYSGDIYIYNNIFSGITANYPINAGAGYTNSMYIKYNRFDSVGYIISQFGGANSDILMDENYFVNCSNSALYFNATGNSTGGEALVSFSNNVVKNCTNTVRLDYQNANYGPNLNFNRVTNNLFYGCKGDYVVYEKMHPECVKNGAHVACLDPKSKTFITGNTFAAQGSSTPAIKLDGAESVLGNDVRFIVSATENKFLFANAADTANTALSGGITGIVDASNCYTNSADKTAIFKFDISFGGSIVTMPYYNDEAMTEIAAAGELSWNKRTMDAYFDTTEGTYGVDGKKLNVYATVKSSDMTTVTLDEYSLSAGGEATCAVFYDFLLSRPVAGNKINLTGDRTMMYVLVTDAATGQTTKYSLVINAKTDKTKADLLYVYDKDTDLDYTGYRWSGDGKTVYVSVDDEDIYFPFYVVASPSATVKYFTDAACTKEYADTTYYMQPDEKTLIYTQIVSGDGKTKNVYTLEFKRTGSDAVDAQIIRARTPVENLIIFNNERKNVIYRPFTMIDSATFDFEVSTNATYTIYEDAACTKAVSTMDEVKELPIGDAITYYYVKVVNSYGFEQTYTLVTYNDVKSTDNVITGITGYTLGEGLTIENNHIVVEASSTLALVNAHFETNAFADIKVYPDEHKSYELTPSITMAVVNNREVEVPTYQLGISSSIALFWIDVTSETGVTNSYTMKIYKVADPDASFKDTKGHWAEKYINDIASLGIVSGVGANQFAPDTFATRQQMAIILCKMLGIESLSFRNVNLGEAFSDANDIAEWAYDYVKGAYALKFMVGSDGKFNPKANITRQEFFVAIASILKLDTKAAASYDLSRFSDVSSVAKWALPYIKACVKAGIVSGSNGKLNPTAYITRAEIATIVSQVTTIRDEVVFG